MKLLSVMATFFLALILFQVHGNPVSAMTEETGALTSPPPVLVEPFTVFDPGFTYLDDGGNSISDLGKQQINISGETYGTVHVDEIGIQLTLQRWTGSSWVDIYSGASTTDTDSAFVFQSHIISSVQKGYYYRTKSLHWIQNGNVNESGTRYSPSILIPL